MPGDVRVERTGPASLRLSLPPRRELLGAASQALMDFLAGWDWTVPLAYRVELVVEEVLMNVVWHAGRSASTIPTGHGGDDAHEADAAPISIDAEVRDDAVRLTFGDAGPPFDPTRAAMPALPTRLEDASPGGLGLLLVHRFASRLAYERREGRNLLVVEFARAPQGSAGRSTGRAHGADDPPRRGGG